jgi:hypothetical protein
MSGIRPILRLMALAWWRWARDELSKRQPLHPDLPMVMRRVAELEGAR